MRVGLTERQNGVCCLLPLLHKVALGLPLPIGQPAFPVLHKTFLTKSQHFIFGLVISFFEGNVPGTSSYSFFSDTFGKKNMLKFLVFVLIVSTLQCYVVIFSDQKS